MGWESPSHWVIIAVVVLVLFGYKKLPEMSRSVGRSLRIFKTEMKGMGEDDSTRDAAEVPPVPPVVTAPVVTTPVVAAPVATQQPAVPAVPVVPTASPVPPAAPVADQAAAPQEQAHS